MVQVWRLLNNIAYLRKNEKMMIIKCIIGCLVWLSTAIWYVSFILLVNKNMSLIDGINSSVETFWTFIIYVAMFNASYLLILIYLFWLVGLNVDEYKTIDGTYR